MEKRDVTYQNRRARKIGPFLSLTYDECDHFASVTDMLTDLMHYCEVHGLNYADAERIAEGHYMHERKKGDQD